MKFFIYLSQVNGSLREVDAVIGQLIDGLKQRGAYDCVNIMLLTDHGKWLRPHPTIDHLTITHNTCIKLK